MGPYTFRGTMAFAAVLAAGALMAACSTPSPPATASVSGTATYRERIALPPDAVFDARLEDVSRADAAAELIASTRTESPGAPPFKFTITFDPARIDATHRYSIRARVLRGDEVLFTSDTHTPLPTGPDAAPIEIMMVQAGLPATATAPATGSALRRGMYSYMADAGQFTDCASGVRVPVAQLLDNAALESAYVKARKQDGAAMLATVVARTEMRAGMEGPPRPTLLVEHFISVAAASCASPGAATLEDSYWRLAQLGNAPVTLAEGQRAPYFVLASSSHRVSGYAGCNRMMGGYTVGGAKLSFTQMAGTMMACAQGMDIEQGFHAALAKTAGWRIDDNRLELLDASGAVVAGLRSE